MSKTFFSSLLLGFIFLLSACQAPSPALDLSQPVDQLPPKEITCKDLKTDLYRQACEEQVSAVAGQILAEEVLTTFDLKRCETLYYDQIAFCKTQLQASGVQGPIALEEAEALNQALQQVFPLSPEEWEALTEEERQGLEGVYEARACQTLSLEKGLRGYCEAQAQEKTELETLAKLLGSGEALNCQQFTTPRGLAECKSLSEKEEERL